MLHRFIFIALSCLFMQMAQSQSLKVSLSCKDCDQKKLNELIEVDTVYCSLDQISTHLFEIRKQLFANAYITASFDSTIQNDSLNATAYLKLGKRYEWASLERGNVDEEAISKIGFKNKLYNHRPFNYYEINKLLDNIIVYYENKGYPFATVRLDSTQIIENELFAHLNVDKGDLQYIDSIHVVSNEYLDEATVSNFIGIKEGALYDEVTLRKIPENIKNVSFLRSTQAYEIDFGKDFNRLRLYLQKRKASKFNGIIAFAPDDKTGKIRFNGDVNVKLINSFHKGEELFMNWKSLNNKSQKLLVEFNYPFLFNSPFGLDFSLRIFKNDTIFINNKRNIGFRYFLNASSHFKFYLSTIKSSILSTEILRKATQLPDYTDATSNIYTIGFFQNKLNYSLNPTKGYEIDQNFGIGIKEIKDHSLQFPQLSDEYAKLKLRSVQYNYEGYLSYFIPLGKNATLKVANQTAFYLTESNNQFENELLRFGGLKTLRGFNEESLSASLYTIGTLEYRYLMEQNSYLFAFIDQAYYEVRTVNNPFNDNPIGFGAGISFETAAGIFTINYALGKQQNNPILVRNAKIHFGIVNVF